MVKIYVDNVALFLRLVSALANGHCAFATSGDSGKFEIRGVWSYAYVTDLLKSAEVTDSELETELQIMHL